MKNSTLKNLFMLMLFIAAFQTSYAQSFPEDQPYRFRTYLASPTDFNATKEPPYVDQFIYPGAKAGSDALTLSPLEASEDYNQLFDFKPVGDKTFEYPAESGVFHKVYNIVSSFDGDGTKGTGVMELNALDNNGHRMRLRGNAYPFDNDIALFILVKTENTDAVTFKMISAAVNTTTPYRAIQPDTNYGGFNYQGTSPASRVGHDEWVLKTESGGDVVLSTSKVDYNTINISNPVKNNLEIRNINSELKEVSVFNLLGSKVLHNKLNGNKKSISIDVNFLSKGVYIVKLSGENSSFSTKIIKE